MNDTLLYDLFDEIRNGQQRASPGLQEYYLLFDVLKQKTAYPIKTFDELAFVLEAIWLKSNQFKDTFRKIIQFRKPLLQKFIEELIQQPEEVANDEINKNAKTENGSGKKEEPKTEEGKKTDGATADVKTEEKKQEETKVEEVKMNDSVETVFSLGSKKAENGGALQIDTTANQPSLLQTPYLFTTDYFPVKSRDLQQNWRTLKNKAAGKDRPDIDMERTVLYTATKGYFSTLVYEKEFKNQLQLFIFIDRADTMAAVEEFGKELYLTAEQSQVHGKKVIPYYFFMVPQSNDSGDDYILFDESYMNPSGLRKLFVKWSRRNIVVLIYSDAGVFKNSLDDELIEETAKFLTFLNRTAGYVAWLNPAPKERWKYTNAERIKEIVPMFDTTKMGIENALAALKGKLFK